MALLNFYAPTKTNVQEQINAFEEIRPLIVNHHDRLILGGDLNLYLDPKMDKKGGKYIDKRSKYEENLVNTMNELDLIDSWRTCNPNVERYTWRENTRNGIVQSRLDYFICPLSKIYDVKKTTIEISMYSDHNPITLQLYIKNQQTRGKGFWKFNTSLLTDETYMKKIKQIIETTNAKYKEIKNKGLLWDVIKTEIRGASISHSVF
jgi:hypothetical protein